MTLQEIQNLTTDQREIQNECYDNPVTFKVYLDHNFEISSDIDEATQQLIKDWFEDRRCPYKFEKYFNRKLALSYKYYLEKLRLDPTVSSFDWFVENYREDLTELVFDRTVDNDTTSTGTGSQTSTNSSSNTTTTSDSTTEATKTDGDARQIGVGRSAPMNASWPWEDTNEFSNRGLAAGEVTMTSNDGAGIANPHITNPSSVQDSFNMTKAVGENKRTGSGTSSSTGSGTGSITSTDSTSSQNDISEHSENQRKQIITGRNNKLSEMIEEASRCIEKSSAWIWLYDELQECFMMTL